MEFWVSTTLEKGFFFQLEKAHDYTIVPWRL